MKANLRKVFAIAAISSVISLTSGLAAYAGPAADIEKNATTETVAVETPSTPAEEAPAPVTTVDKDGMTYLGVYKATAYCNCSRCSSSGTDLTASGVLPVSRHTISANLREFGFGTKLYIDGIVYTVEDTGSFGPGAVDIYFDTHQQALNYGVHYVDVYLVK